jgi:hypothetical protein
MDMIHFIISILTRLLKNLNNIKSCIPFDTLIFNHHHQINTKFYLKL